MEIGKQIKRYRNELNFSQEELAEKVYVSRQTISNWENDKNYPDIKSLLLLSTVFDISLDTLVKGDLEDMREKIRASEVKPEDYEKFKKDSKVFYVLTIYSILFTFPILINFNEIGKIIAIGMWALTIYYSIRVEKLKKIYDIKTYREILAFYEGETLSDVDKLKEEGKSKYQKFIIVIVFWIISIGLFLGSILLYTTDTWSNMPWGYQFLAFAQIANLVMLTDNIYDSVKQKKNIKSHLIITGLVILHLVLTLVVGLGILSITPVTYCVISLILLILIVVLSVTMEIFREEKEK